MQMMWPNLNARIFILPAVLGGPVGTFAGIILPCPPTSGIERSGPQSSCACHLHAHNPQTPIIFTRPPSSHTPRPRSDDSSHRFSYSKWRYLLVMEEEEEEEEEEEMKLFTGCCPLEDLSRVCTPSHHCPSLATQIRPKPPHNAAGVMPLCGLINSELTNGSRAILKRRWPSNVKAK